MPIKAKGSDNYESPCRLDGDPDPHGKRRFWGFSCTSISIAFSNELIVKYMYLMLWENRTTFQFGQFINGNVL